MQPKRDAELLEEFVENSSEEAFRTLVDRHLPLVFGTARRMTQNPALAEEVAQTVFILLAQKAGTLAREKVLSGWLFRTTRFVASRAIRSEQRRRQREETAMTMHLHDTRDETHTRIAAQLDEALARLGEQDRRAVLLRYFEGRKLSEVGTTLGIGEEAAKKRVSRAIDKLRLLLGRRGVNVSAAALAAAITAEAALSVPEQFASRVLARMAASGGAAAGGALFEEVLRSLLWSKIKLGTAVVTCFLGLVGGGLIFSTSRRDEMRVEPVTASESITNKTAFEALPPPPPSSGLMETQINGVRVALKRLTINVIDAATSTPIAGAEVFHTLAARRRDGLKPESLRTGTNGAVEVILPEELPGASREITQFQAFVKADGYAPRDVMWLCSTGGVLRTVGSEYTVKLERGITLAGTVVDDSGQPLSHVKLNVVGNNYRGYSYSVGEDGKITTPPVIRAEDFSSFSVPAESSVRTDKVGHFELRNFPADLARVMFEFITPEGAHHKFLTLEGASLTTEKLPEIKISDLRSGTARFVLARGIDVAGKVVDAQGQAIAGAQVVEARMLGNLQVLSRTETDASGAFRLTGRKPREILLGVSAAGHASLSTLATVAPGMGEIVLRLPSENPLRGRVEDVNGQPISGATVMLPDSRNDGLALEWKVETDAEGKFAWMGAPTNELFVYVSAREYGSRLQRVKANGDEHRILLQDGGFETMRLTGFVTDASSGREIDFFEIKVHSADRGALPSYLRHNAEGRLGYFDVEFDLREKGLSQGDALVLLLEADGYETLMTRQFFVEEGNQNFQLQMRPGGLLAGTVFTPEGTPAVGASFAVAQERDRALASGTGELSRKCAEVSDAKGEFQFRTPVKATALIIYHESGWAIESLKSATAKLNVHLKPWARIDVNLKRESSGGEYVTLNSLRVEPPNSLQVLYTVEAKGDGITFSRVPAGEFIVSFNPEASKIVGPAWMNTLETTVVVSAGESKTVELGGEGQTIVGHLQFPPELDQDRLDSLIVLLTRDAQLAPRGLEYYASHRSMSSVWERQETDPAYLAAKRQERTYLSEVSSEGAIVFRGVAPGHYTLRAKLFGSGPRAGWPRLDRPVIALAERHVEVGEAPTNNLQDLGIIILDRQ